MIPVDLYKNPDETELRQLVAWARDEANELDKLIPAATDAQWCLPPVPSSREEATERAIGTKTDPTALVSLDDKRLRLRAQVVRSANVLRHAIAALRGVRLGLASALLDWQGERGVTQ